MFKRLLQLFFISFIISFSLGRLYNSTLENDFQGSYTEEEYSNLFTNNSLLIAKDTASPRISQRPLLGQRVEIEPEEPNTETPSTKPEPTPKTTPKPTPTSKPGVKIAYLTFDDGPSKNTVKILDILKDYNIKATFFVNGRSGEEYEEIYRRIVREGHKLGNHTYSHDYKKIYSSVDSFIADYKKLNNHLYKITGVVPDIMRFPGGSNNQVSWKYSGKGFMKNQLIPAIKSKGYVYFDWNVSCGDADGGHPSKETLVKNVKDTLRNQNNAVILFHDSSGASNTPSALPEIIDYLKEKGYSFDTLTRDSPSCKFR
jgi:peptidoglycan-N-acetylglucosamine deacetylase